MDNHRSYDFALLHLARIKSDSQYESHICPRADVRYLLTASLRFEGIWREFPLKRNKFRNSQSQSSGNNRTGLDVSQVGD